MTTDDERDEALAWPIPTLRCPVVRCTHSPTHHGNFGAFCASHAQEFEHYRIIRGLSIFAMLIMVVILYFTRLTTVWEERVLWFFLTVLVSEIAIDGYLWHRHYSFFFPDGLMHRIITGRRI